MPFLLYQIPAGKRTHHSNDFFLSPATFTFELAVVARAFKNFIARLDVHAAKYIVGRGHKDERVRAVAALEKVESLASVQEAAIECPASVCDILVYVFGKTFQDQVHCVRCHKCDIIYAGRDLVKSNWKVDNGDNRRSSGVRLACHRGHYVYANIETVVD